MVAARHPSSGGGGGLANPIRHPLIPSDQSNATIPSSSSSSKKTKSKEITSRYLSSPSSPSPSSSRRFPSPLLTPRPSTPPALPQSKHRSHSVDRSRPQQDPASATASRALHTTTRSLSVSFQGESFFYQTSKASPNRKATPERRRSTDARSENLKPADHSHSQRWPAARSLTRSLDCSESKKDPILATVRLLQQSSVLSEDGTRRVSFDGSDSDSVSSGSNSGVNEVLIPPGAKVTARGVTVPPRLWQENNGSRMIKSPSVRRSSIDGPVGSPRAAASPSRAVSSSSPSKAVGGGGSPAVGMASPLRGKGSLQQVGNAPSIISFAAEVRRAKKGENRIEEAHQLRLLDNRHLQWRWVNARANAALLLQRLATEKALYDAWMKTTELRDFVTRKRIKLQLLTHSLKLTSILKEQMIYLEEWSHMDRDHSSSLSGAIEALKASTLRLPVVGGARADLKEVKDAVSSAVDVMQAMGSSICSKCSLLSKVEGTSSLVYELCKIAEQERSVLNQARDILSSVAAMHVKQCSLHGHILQLRCKQRQAQV